VKVFQAETLHDTALDEIATLIRSGGVIAFPTDTAYGLGADPFDSRAVDRVFRIKGRPESKPILLLIDSIDMAASAIQPAGPFYKVAQKFWPGPLTIVTHAAPELPSNVTAGTATIGIRWPVAPFATRLVTRLGKPVTATSANRSGLPGTITAEEVLAQLGESLDALVDGGTLPARAGSTLLDLTVDPPAVLREGPVTFETLAGFFNGRIRRSVL
jgi:L-threonylcarbamoyladenylate synthase